MFKKPLLVGLFSETSLHPGTGTTTGVIDLPIQRERHTGFPIMQASGLKGAMRELAENIWCKSSPEVNIIFGPEKSENAGSIGITDARLLAFPVRSLSEVYVWITCPTVLNRLKRDMEIAKILIADLPDIMPQKEKTLTTQSSGLSGKLILEEMLFTVDTSDASQNGNVEKWINEIIKFLPNNTTHNEVKKKMHKHLVVIHDDDFAYLVRYATQVSARIELKTNKTSNNLWYEESLPPDTLFYTMIFPMEPRANHDIIKKATDVIEALKCVLKDYIQVGGNETVGMGWCALGFYGDGGGLK